MAKFSASVSVKMRIDYQDKKGLCGICLIVTINGKDKPKAIPGAKWPLKNFRIDASDKKNKRFASGTLKPWKVGGQVQDVTVVNLLVSNAQVKANKIIQKYLIADEYLDHSIFWNEFNSKESKDTSRSWRAYQGFRLARRFLLRK